MGTGEWRLKEVAIGPLMDAEDLLWSGHARRLKSCLSGHARTPLDPSLGMTYLMNALVGATSSDWCIPICLIFIDGCLPWMMVGRPLGRFIVNKYRLMKYAAVLCADSHLYYLLRILLANRKYLDNMGGFLVDFTPHNHFAIMISEGIFPRSVPFIFFLSLRSFLCLGTHLHQHCGIFNADWMTLQL